MNQRRMKCGFGSYLYVPFLTCTDQVVNLIMGNNMFSIYTVFISRVKQVLNVIMKIFHCLTQLFHLYYTCLLSSVFVATNENFSLILLPVFRYLNLIAWILCSLVFFICYLSQNTDK